MRSGPPRILHAEPDAEVVSTVRETLARERPDATVDTVETAAAALDALAERRYDCVVTGSALPDRDGLELLVRVRERDADLPVVLFTGADDEAVASEAIAAGITDFVRKEDPESYRLLAARVDNVVENRRTAAALEESRRRLRTLVSNLPGLVYRASVEDPWEMTFVGGRAEGVTGYPAEAFERGEVTFGDDLILPADRERVRETVGETVPEGGSFEITYRIRTADGERRHVREHGQTVVEDGDPVALEGFIMDITEQVERERHLQAQNDRLDEFASTVSHDLRSPLNVAVGRLSMVDADDPNLDAAREALERMDGLIDDLLALAREGRTVEETEPVDLSRLAREAWGAVRTNDATLVVETEQTVPAAEPQLRRVLENLFRNAVEHAVPGVTVTVGAVDGGFYVADDGPGIPADERERVFERGYSTAPDGTGFGLTIVEHAVEAHGWEISVSESEASGARFDITGVE